MTLKIIPLVGIAAILGAGMGGAWCLRQTTLQQRVRLSELQRNAARSELRKEQQENRRLLEVRAQMNRGEAEVGGVLRDEIQIARREVKELERRAEIAHATAAERSANRVENLDPAQGFVRPESDSRWRGERK